MKTGAPTSTLNSSQIFFEEHALRFCFGTLRAIASVKVLGCISFSQMHGIGWKDFMEALKVYAPQVFLTDRQRQKFCVRAKVTDRHFALFEKG